MYWRKQKYAKRGQCNLCGETADLTWDHVPPQACGNRSPTQHLGLTQFLSGQELAQGQISQNGNKYRTLCGHCNSTMGRLYDNQLAEFVLRVRDSIERPPLVGREIAIECQPGAIARAVVGHLVAAQMPGPGSAFDGLAKQFLLDPTKALPSNLYFHTWIHVFDTTTVIRDSAILSNDDAVVCQVLSFYPLGFIVTQDSPLESVPGFSVDSTVPWDGEGIISLSLDPIYPDGWPWHPTFSKILFGGEALQTSRRVSSSSR